MVPLPDEASYDLGASLGVPAVTAHRALTAAEGGPTGSRPGALDGRVGAGRRRRRRGRQRRDPARPLGGGDRRSPRSAATRRPRWPAPPAPTTSSTTASGDAAAEIRAIAPDGVDIVVEVAPAQNNALDLAVLADHGTIAIYANNGGDRGRRCRCGRRSARNLRYQFVLLYTLGHDLVDGRGRGHQRRGGRRRPAGRRGARACRCTTTRSRTAAAHDAVEGGAVGKVLVDVAEAGSGGQRQPVPASGCCGASACGSPEAWAASIATTRHSGSALSIRGPVGAVLVQTGSARSRAQDQQGGASGHASWVTPSPRARRAALAGAPLKQPTSRKNE